MLKKKKSKLKIAQEEAQAAINRTNEQIEELGKLTANLYFELNNIQKAFDAIRNVPNEKKLQYEKLKQIRLNWKQQAEKIEKDYNDATIKNTGVGVAGAGVGVAVVTMGPTVAMGIATTFGVASTGTAISTLSGAAANSAALAWLGGGALSAGGGGMAAGKALLALASPIGWAIAGIALLTGGFLFYKLLNDKKHIEDIFAFISKRDVTSYDLAIVELKERIIRIADAISKLHDANNNIRLFGSDYNMMSEKQQYELGSYVNLMSSSTQLLVNPIRGLLPKYTDVDFEEFTSKKADKKKSWWYSKYKLPIVSLANLLYKIELNNRDKKLLWKTLRKNKKMLKTLKISKKEFGMDIIDAIIEALNYKYTLSMS